VAQELNYFWSLKKMGIIHWKNNVVGFLVLLSLSLGMFAVISGGFFHKRERPPPVSEDLFKKVKILRLSEKLPAQDFTLADLNGRRVTLEDLRGKVVFLNFWATWCPPCILEMPTMEKLHGEFGGNGLVILAVNFRESPERVKAFLNEQQLTFTTLLDPKGKVFELYQAWSLPTTTIVNKKGQAVGKVIGYRDWHKPEMKEFFRRLLGEE